ncbi:hypothetical protein ACFL5A_04110, partial [Gemmatimonadota bacterium]
MYRFVAVITLALVAVCTAPMGVQAQGAHAPMMESVSPDLFQGLQFRLVGPNQGGRSTVVTGVPSQPNTFYQGVASGGV